MWLCKVSDFTSNSEIQHTSPPWRQGQGCVHLTEAKYGGWRSDGTAGAISGISPPEDREPEARGPGRGRSLGQQEMEEDGNEQERSGNIGV